MNLLKILIVLINNLKIYKLLKNINLNKNLN